MKNAAANPGSTACEMASPSMLMRRSTKKLPGIAAATPHKQPTRIGKPSSDHDRSMASFIATHSRLHPGQLVVGGITRPDRVG